MKIIALLLSVTLCITFSNVSYANVRGDIKKQAEKLCRKDRGVWFIVYNTPDDYVDVHCKNRRIYLVRRK